MSKPLLLLGSLLFCSATFAFVDHGKVDLVKVDKSERKMYLLYEGRVLREYRIALGPSPKGHKQQQGDGRTPEGIYVLDFKKEDSDFYRSMHISYPNHIDKRLAEHRGVSPGGFIMVHGQKDEKGWIPAAAQQVDWTNGCIAITNEEMDEFMALVSVGTKIHIEW